ncbi:MAG: hypothetical protein VX278_03210, partial [Myxococcota bacterium]|nr:hypothetical protein [Myxococcota bacterium]
GSALVLGTVATKFSSTDRLMPWLLEFSQHYSSHPVSIAGTVFFGFICSQYYNGSTLLEAIEAFGEWRQSSVALKSPVPDQTFWAYQQASWIALEYNRRPMMEFVGQHLSTTLATPCSNQALTMIPFALSLAQNFADIGSLMHYLSDESILMSRSALTAIGALCGILMGKNLTSLPKGVEIYNRQLLEEPEDWVATSEQNAPMTKFALLRQNEKSNQQLKLF